MVLASYPLAVGLASSRLREGNAAPALASDFLGLMLTVLQTYVFFGFFFGVAWIASRANATQLLLDWKNGWSNLLLGLGYGVAMQVVVRIIIVGILLAAVAITLVAQGGPFTMQSIQDAALQFAQQYRPKTENLVDGAALVSNPLYFLGMMTIVSFLMAGFTEELWRARGPARGPVIAPT